MQAGDGENKQDMIGAIFTVAIVFILTVEEIIFIVRHNRPLTENEIKELSEARRREYINRNFHLSHTSLSINSNYRSSLEKAGRWDRINIAYSNSCSFLTELLRYKRHEWFVILIADEHQGKLIWANKGNDNASCYFKGRLEEVVRLAEQNKCNTVIMMHNHPHTADRSWNLLIPSDTDLHTFDRCRNFFDEHGLNLIDAVCSMGEFSVYGQNFAQSFFPSGTSFSEISLLNDASSKDHLRLHYELRLKKRIKLKTVG